MDGLKRHRVELDAYSYEVIRYFGLLRGVSVGSIMRRSLSAFASAIVKEFPPVEAHMLAMAAAEANDQNAKYDGVEMVPF